MNNINGVDTTRAVVTDANVTNTGGSKGAAKSEVDGGKDLPPSTRSQAAEPSKQVATATLERSARVEQAVEQLNDYVQSIQRDLRFSLDEDLGRTVVRVVDRNTQEVIRQIPNETALQLARNLKDYQEYQQSEIQRQPASNSAEASLGLINTRI